MENFIKVNMLPNRISKERWDKVYKETLIILQNYCFMDKITEKRHGMDFTYSKRSCEREGIWNTKELGWNIIGDFESGEFAGEFNLCADIEAYRTEIIHEDKKEILLSQLENIDEKYKPNVITIWNSNTQKLEYNTYILAIACLLESRIPEAITVYGDISLLECKKAIKWANGFLENPIELPVRAYKERLFERLSNLNIPEDVVLKVFLDLSMEVKDYSMGEFLKNNFSKEVLYKYHKDRAKNYKIGTLEYSRFINKYLKMGFDLDTLCRVSTDEQIDNKNVQEVLCEEDKTSWGRDVQGKVRKFYDINSVKEFKKYKTGDRIEPSIEKHLCNNFKILHKISEEEYDERFKILDNIEREKYFIQKSGHFLLPEEFWNRIFENIMEDDFIVKIYPFFRIKSEEAIVYRWIISVLSNMDLINDYWKVE